MKVQLIVWGALSTGAAAAVRAMPEPMRAAMAEKQKQWAQGWRDGEFGGAAMYPAQTRHAPCVKGVAKGVNGAEFKCNNVDWHAFLSHEDLGSTDPKGNDIWGWVSKDGREFAAVGQRDGTAFVEVVEHGRLRYVGRLPTQTHNSEWRDMKVIGSHIYIGSEARNHGLQIFDMRKLLHIKKKPKVFDINKDLTAWFRGFGSSHNIVANEETNMIYPVGMFPPIQCQGGMFMLDVSNPAKPKSFGCDKRNKWNRYVHDATCHIYKGPTKKYQGREICFDFNVLSFAIVDVTNRTEPYWISNTHYYGEAYTHQGWLTDDSMKYLLLDDEQDEQQRVGPAKNGHTTTYIVDISDLERPVFTGHYQSPVVAIDHNQYVKDGLSYQSNYGSGLRIVNVSSVHADPTGAGFKEVGFFDVRPKDDDLPGGGRAAFFGAWSSYPYFPSGFIVLNSIERGVFSLKFKPK